MVDVPKTMLEQRRQQTISPVVADLLVDQIPRELHNHAVYRTFANYFSLKSLTRLEEYYIKRAEEELNHHRWIVDRLNYCDVAFSYPAVPPVEEDIISDIYPFQRTVDLEIETTKWIFEIATAAKEEKDWETFEWLQETLVKEQNEEESTSRSALDIASLSDGWLTKEKSILHLLKS